jgi:outer membrane protein
MAAAALLIGAGTLASCNDSKQDTKPAAKTDKVAAKDNLPNYRYVDLDTVLAKYALAKDYNEEMMRMQSSMESTMRTHEKRLQSQAAVMQNKMNNNGYLTRESYEQDQSSLNSMQAEAQKQAATLQSNFEQQALQAQKNVNDSINAFIEEYNKSRGYDAIFFKAATLYINPALDVTDEVVEGLNARYNKLKK